MYQIYYDHEHPHWFDNIDSYICSNCGFEWGYRDERCPKCGATMLNGGSPKNKATRKYYALYDIKVAIPITAENDDEAEKVASDLKPEVSCYKAIGNCKVDECSYRGLLDN